MRGILFACAWLITVVALAIPAKRIKRTITLEDGTKKEVVFMGDEHVHFYADAEGNAYQENSSGSFVKVDRQVLTTRWQERLSARNAVRARRANARKAQWGATSNPISGSRKGLVILINYKDKSLNSTHNNTYFNNYFNQVGFSQDNMGGSVHDYFKECSYGQFDLTFDVVGPVTVSQNMSYYGGNDSNGDDLHPAELVIEACKLADNLGTDFSKYDWDGDGYVDQVFCVYAGYGEHVGASANTIWPHESELSSCALYGDGTGSLRLDGVVVNTYAVSCELAGKTGSVANGIGTACHEFSHCMCLPDMYDTQGLNFGMDSWDLMDYGSYSGKDGRGECPTGYTSYERMYCGWLTPTELNAPCNVTSLKPLAQNAEAYIIYNQKNKNEYYLLENRQKVGFHTYDKANGMLILHVDFDEDAWIENTVNNEKSHQRMTIFAADNSLSSSSLAGDTWPGTSKKTSFTDTTSPASTLYNANSNGSKKMGKPITNIAESNGVISFTFDGGSSTPTPDAPVAKAATNITTNGFVANWGAVSGATQYELELTTTDIDNGGNTGDDTGGSDDNTGTSADLEKAVILMEDFCGFKKGTADGTTDVGESMDSYTKVKGWEGYKIYTTPNAEIKMGSSKNGGELYSPWLESKKGTVTVVVAARRYNSDGNTMYFTYGEDINGETVASISLETETKYYILEVDDISADFWVGVVSDARAYVSEFYVLDGTYTDAQLENMFKSPRRVNVSSIRKVASGELAITPRRAGLAEGSVIRKAAATATYKTTATSYTFSNLATNKTYSYRVRAINNGVAGAWSNTIKVELATGIEGVKVEKDESDKNVKVYDMSGREVNRAAQHGVYIVNGRKVLR